MLLAAKRSALRRAERLLWLTAVVALGAWGLARADSILYQFHARWSFDRMIHTPAPPRHFPLDSITLGTPAPARTDLSSPSKSRPTKHWLARLEIPKIGLSAMVVDGTSRGVLERAVGHIPGTALPGATGNIGLAGHRDTFFRRLDELRIGDTLRLRTADGDYEFAVDRIDIVHPQAVQVLEDTETLTLTLVTCYPFEMLGPAPERYVVKAVLSHPQSTDSTSQ